MVKINYDEKLQEYFFKKCIIENPEFFGNPTEFNIKIDHKNGKNYLNDKEYNMLFPLSLVEFVKSLPKEKTSDYYFQGYIGLNRIWINQYKDKGKIVSSMSGREPSTKYNVDVDYYKTMCGTKFTLTPTGDCPWSYRFFESIMCHSIPVLEDNTNDIYHHLFKCFSHSDNHTYNISMAEHNYKVFIENFTPTLTMPGTS